MVRNSNDPFASVKSAYIFKSPLVIYLYSQPLARLNTLTGKRSTID
jgi:hypothetical protein